VTLRPLRSVWGAAKSPAVVEVDVSTEFPDAVPVMAMMTFAAEASGGTHNAAKQNMNTRGAGRD
jgi:hypothetical protein